MKSVSPYVKIGIVGNKDINLFDEREMLGVISIKVSLCNPNVEINLMQPIMRPEGRCLR